MTPRRAVTSGSGTDSRPAGLDEDGTATGAVLFTDLVGFTEYTDAVGDAAAVGVLDHQAEILSAVLDCHRGRLVKELGDGLMLWFDDAATGLDAAVELMNGFTEARQRGTFPLAVRMGLHHGEVVERGGDLIGGTVNLASRVSDLAGPGEILISDEVFAACDQCHQHGGARPIGPATVKGVSRPVWLHRLECS